MNIYFKTICDRAGIELDTSLPDETIAELYSQNHGVSISTITVTMAHRRYLAKNGMLTWTK